MGPAGKHPTLFLYFSVSHLMSFKAPGTEGGYQRKSGWPQQTHCVLACASRHRAPPSYYPALSLIILVMATAMKVLSTRSQSSNAQLGIASWLSHRGLTQFCLSLESTVLLCCGTEVPPAAARQHPLLPDLTLPDFTTHLLHKNTDTHTRTVPLSF